MSLAQPLPSQPAPSIALRLGLALLLAVAWLTPTSFAERDPMEEVDPQLQAMNWRELGPYRGGRSAAVAGLKDQPHVYYFGSTGGGVWKTEDGGTSWDNVSDGYFGGSIGAVAVSEWDPNVVYVGGGEKTVRGNVSHGDGVWRSTDGGKSWAHLGLGETRHVPRIRIHPKDADWVYVAALGHLYGPNDERGVFRSKDGGESWEKILFVDENAGCVDLTMAPSNPRILYASFWQIKRTPYSLESGGEHSSLWKSVDGGDNWEKVSDNQGFPKGPLGIIGIDVSAQDAENIYAMVEAEDGGVYRSRDGGETWTRTNKERNLRQRAWYYTRIYADPTNIDSVYVLNVRFHHSVDGGKSFKTISTPHGDNHDLWIAPDDGQRMIEANDGGANVTFDGGRTWSVQSNQPTAQMYRVSVDNAFPYRLLGGQQDNSAIRIRHRSLNSGGVSTRDWESTAGGESGHIVAKPDDPDVVYGGSYGGFLTMVNHRTGERRAVNVWPDNPMGWGAAELTYRFQWNFPIFFSPHNPERLYAAANVLFRSDNGGESWTAISPDLTRNDKSKMGPSGGPITKDNTSVEYYGTIFAALESPHERDTLWAGSDDGRLHLTRDGGNSWQDVTPKRMPEWMQINSIEADPFEPGGLYVAGTRYKLDDFTPYLYRTKDYGKSWKRIDAGIPRDHFTRVIRADDKQRELLYAGTENGVYYSGDGGGSWTSLQLNLPISPVTDLAVKEGDLIAATQGRGYWILDDLTPIRQGQPADRDAPQLLAPRDTYRLGAGRSRSVRNMGQNPPGGVSLFYRLPAEPEAETPFELEILDEDGSVVRTFTRKPKPDSKVKLSAEERETAQLETKAGLNQFVWNLRYPGAKRVKGLVLWNGNLAGPRAVPGRYKARLTVGDFSEEVSFKLLADPRSSASRTDFQKQFDFISRVSDKVTETHQALNSIREMKQQIGALHGRLKQRDLTELADQASEIKESLTEIESTLYQTKMESPQDPLNFPIKLNDKLAGLMGLAGIGDFRPTEQMESVRRELTEQIDVELARFTALIEGEVAALNAAVARESLPALELKELDDEPAVESAD